MAADIAGTLHRAHMVEFVLELLVTLCRQINNLFCHGFIKKIRIPTREGQNPDTFVLQR